MISYHILRAWEHSISDLHDREKTQMPQRKTKISHDVLSSFSKLQKYNGRSTCKEHKKVFPNVPVTGFWNDQNVKDYLVRATLPKLNQSEIWEPCGKKICLVLNCSLRWESENQILLCFNNHEDEHRAFRKGKGKVTQKLLHTRFCLDGDSNIGEDKRSEGKRNISETFW